MLILFLLFCLLGLSIGGYIYYPINQQNHNECSSLVLDDVKSRDNIYIDNTYCYIGLSEFGTSKFWDYFVDMIYRGSGNIFGTGVSYGAFQNSTPIEVDTSNLDISFGNISTTTGEFEFSRSITSLYIVASFPNSYGYSYTFRFVYDTPLYYQVNTDVYLLNGSDIKAIYTDITNWNNVSGNNDQRGLIVRYKWSDFYGLLPNDYSLLENQRSYNEGYDYGYNEGYDEGFDKGTEISLDPTSEVYQIIFNRGKQTGYSEGYESALEQGTTAATIFSGIVNIGLLPVNVFLTIFEFEVFGINIAGLVSALLTVAVTIILIRFLSGQKNDK